MGVTKVTKESWKSKIRESITGVIAGIVLFAGSFPLLFWNEGRAIHVIQALEESEKNVVEADCRKYDPANEGNIVHMTGNAKTTDILNDNQFGITKNALSITRTVEMYQWVEHESSSSETTTYKYSREWRKRLVKSSYFTESGHDNPSEMPFEEQELHAKNVYFGTFTLNESQIDDILDEQEIQLSQGYIIPDAMKTRGAVIHDNKIYLPVKQLTTQTDADITPEVGDVRITLSMTPPETEASIIAMQTGKTFSAYVASNGNTVSLATRGIITARLMFEQAHGENIIITWLLRLLGFFVMFLGLLLIMKPLSLLGDVIPLVGGIIEFSTKIAALFVSIVLSFITIAVAWFFYRPVYSIMLLAAAGACLLAIKRKKPQTQKTDTETV